MKNKMVDLRNHLFAALEGLSDTEKPMELDRAKAISEVAQTIINSARVEVDLCKATGLLPQSDFIETDQPPRKPRLVGNG
jgi:hypothetical protein